MSDTATTTTPGVAGPASPLITVYARADGSLVGHIHQRDKLRTCFGRDLPELARYVQSALISEFRLMPDDAQAVADAQGLRPLMSEQDVAAAVAKERSRADSLQAQLNVAQSEIRKLRADAAKMAEELKAAIERADAAEKKLAAAEEKVSATEDMAVEALQRAESAEAELDMQAAHEPEPEDEKPAKSKAKPKE